MHDVGKLMAEEGKMGENISLEASAFYERLAEDASIHSLSMISGEHLHIIYWSVENLH